MSTKSRAGASVPSTVVSTTADVLDADICSLSSSLASLSLLTQTSYPHTPRISGKDHHGGSIQEDLDKEGNGGASTFSPSHPHFTWDKDKGRIVKNKEVGLDKGGNSDITNLEDSGDRRMGVSNSNHTCT